MGIPYAVSAPLDLNIVARSGDIILHILGWGARSMLPVPVPELSRPNEAVYNTTTRLIESRGTVHWYPALVIGQSGKGAKLSD